MRSCTSAFALSSDTAAQTHSNFCQCQKHTFGARKEVRKRKSLQKE